MMMHSFLSAKQTKTYQFLLLFSAQMLAFQGIRQASRQQKEKGLPIRFCAIENRDFHGFEREKNPSFPLLEKKQIPSSKLHEEDG